jgi:hypothetical protein
MTNESAFFIEPKIVFGEIQPLLENNFSISKVLINLIIVKSKSWKPRALDTQHNI